MIELSVIIPTCDRPKILEKVLNSLEKQTYPQEKFEIIVIDDGSATGNQEKIKNLIEKLKVKSLFLKQNHSGPAAARNKGVKAANGKIVLIINDDTVADLNLIRRHFEFHRKHPAGKFGLLGYVTWHSDLVVTPFMNWLEDGGPYFSFGEIEGKEAGWERLWTCNVSLKRDFLLKNGLFDEEFPYAAWEDVELGYRLGKKGLRLFYEKKAIGYHYHPTTVSSIKNKMLANGESTLILKRKLPYSLLPPLAKFPKMAVFLDTFLFPRPVAFLLKEIALWAEKRFRFDPIFDILLLHYRIEGIKR